MNFTVAPIFTPRGRAIRRLVANASGDVAPLEIEATAAGVSIGRRWPTISTRADLNAVMSQLEQAWSDHLSMRGKTPPAAVTPAKPKQESKP